MYINQLAPDDGRAASSDFTFPTELADQLTHQRLICLVQLQTKQDRHPYPVVDGTVAYAQVTTLVRIGCRVFESRFWHTSLSLDTIPLYMADLQCFLWVLRFFPPHCVCVLMKVHLCLL